MGTGPPARVQFRLGTDDAFANLRRRSACAPIRRQAVRSMKGLSLDSLAGLVAARGAALARLAILAGIAYTLASAALFFVPIQQPVVEAAAPTAPQIIARNKPPVDVEAILAAKFFGDAQAEKEAAAAQVQPAVETRLPLTLNGVFVAQERRASAAIIAERNKPELLYQVGERLPGNATLQSVAPDHVVLLRGGAKEILRFPETHEFRRIKGGAKTSAPRRPEPNLAAPRRNQPSPADAPKDFIASFLAQPEGDEEAHEERRALLREARREAIRAQGFRVGELAQLPYFKQNGLEAQDMILSLNGQPVADMDMSEAALAKLLSSGPIQLEVQRAGQLLSLTASANP